MSAASKIGHGHELVIVARKTAITTDKPLYLTAGRSWTDNPASARLFLKASEAHKKTAGLQVAGRTVTVEGIFTEAFGHA